jgi:hypothetical protein
MTKSGPNEAWEEALEDEEFKKEQRHIMKRLVKTMERGENAIDLAYFTEAMCWWSEDILLELGVKKDVYRNTTFFETKNGCAYLHHGSGLFLV